MNRLLLVLVLVGAVVLVVILMTTSPAQAAQPALPGDQVPGEPPPPMGIQKGQPIPVAERPSVTVATSQGPVTLEKAYTNPSWVTGSGLTQTSTPLGTGGWVAAAPAGATTTSSGGRTGPITAGRPAAAIR